MHFQFLDGWVVICHWEDFRHGRGWIVVFQLLHLFVDFVHWSVGVLLSYPLCRSLLWCLLHFFRKDRAIFFNGSSSVSESCIFIQGSFQIPQLVYVLTMFMFLIFSWKLFWISFFSGWSFLCVKKNLNIFYAIVYLNISRHGVLFHGFSCRVYLFQSVTQVEWWHVWVGRGGGGQGGCDLPPQFSELWKMMLHRCTSVPNMLIFVFSVSSLWYLKANVKEEFTCINITIWSMQYFDSKQSLWRV